MKKIIYILLLFISLFITAGCSYSLPSDYQKAVDAYENNTEFKDWFINKKNVDNKWINDESVLGVELLDNLLSCQNQGENLNTTYFNNLGINYIAKKEDGKIRYNDKDGHKYEFENEDDFILWYGYQVFIGAKLPALNDYRK